MDNLFDLLDKYWNIFKGDMNYIGNEFTSASNRAKYAVNRTKRHFQSGQTLLNQAGGIQPGDPQPIMTLDELYRGPGKVKKLLDQLTR